MAWQDAGFTWESMKPVAGDYDGNGLADIATLYKYGTPSTKIWNFLGNASGPQAPSVAWQDPGWTWESTAA